VAKVYIETTIPSYLAAKPSRDIIVAAQQQVTAEWWSESHRKYDLYLSEAVLDECAAGDHEAAGKRLKFIGNLPILKITTEVVRIAIIYGKLLAIPDKSKADAVHLALAVYHEMDYLLTWNCKHGLFEPMIVTPSELLERR
jgi:predicted nucleic acid-binding protein